MLIAAVYLGYAAIGIALAMNLWRLAVGPAVADRILALDTMTINTIALVLLYGVHTGSALFFEAALILAVIGFVTTIALARMAMRARLTE